MTRYCCVCGAERSVRNEHLTFHHFPSDPDKRKKWLQVLKQVNIRGRVCSQHFKPEHYREMCDKRRLKADAIPSINIPELDTDIQLMGNDEQNCETCTVPIESYLEIEYSADESDNIESVTKDCAMSTGSIKSLERANNSCNESTAPAGKRCVLNEFGVFRREDFIDEITWNRFLRACNGLRREKLLLKRKNERLLKKIKTFSDIIEELQKKNLLTDSLAEILKVNYRT